MFDVKEIKLTSGVARKLTYYEKHVNELSLPSEVYELANENKVDENLYNSDFIQFLEDNDNSIYVYDNSGEDAALLSFLAHYSNNEKIIVVTAGYSSMVEDTMKFYFPDSKIVSRRGNKKMSAKFENEIQNCDILYVTEREILSLIHSNHMALSKHFTRTILINNPNVLSYKANTLFRDLPHVSVIDVYKIKPFTHEFVLMDKSDTLLKRDFMIHKNSEFNVFSKNKHALYLGGFWTGFCNPLKCSSHKMKFKQVHDGVLWNIDNILPITHGLDNSEIVVSERSKCLGFNHHILNKNEGLSTIPYFLENINEHIKNGLEFIILVNFENNISKEMLELFSDIAENSLITVVILY